MQKGVWMTLFAVADTLGIITFAYAGLLVGVEKKLDLLGIVILAFLTALGGGLIRDMLAGEVPYSLTHMLPASTVLVTVATALLFKLYDFKSIENSRLFIITDAVGLSAFSIAGAIVGLHAGLNGFGVVLVGFVTAVGGGIIRDVLINRVPLLLRRDFYGSVAIIVAFSVYLLELSGFKNEAALMGVFALGVLLRLLAYFRKWQLPAVG